MRYNIIIRKCVGFIGLIRPFTLLAPFIVSMNIMIASYFYQGATDQIISVFLMQIIPASLSFAFLNGASNALNQAKRSVYRSFQRKLPSSLSETGVSNQAGILTSSTG